MDGIGKKTILMVFKNQIKVVGFIVKKYLVIKQFLLLKNFRFFDILLS